MNQNPRKFILHRQYVSSNNSKANRILELEQQNWNSPFFVELEKEKNNYGGFNNSLIIYSFINPENYDQANQVV